jgi:oxaloacetate decarboxylase alpha subunit
VANGSAADRSATDHAATDRAALAGEATAGGGSKPNGRSVGFVDTTIRDGNQSLWSLTGLTTPDIVAVAPVLERVGYEALDFTSSTHIAMAVRFSQEDPWERLRLMAEAMPSTKLSMIGTGLRFIVWVPVGEDLMRLALRTAVRNGLRRFQIADPSNDPVRIVRAAPLPDRRSLERSGTDPEVRRARQAGGSRTGRRRDDLLDQPGPHPRLLRASAGGAGRLR